MVPRPIVEAFDSYLNRQELRFDAVVIGGAALALLGVVARETRDLDVLSPLLSQEISEAARSFAKEQQRAGLLLAEDWLNNGPSDLCRLLPSGWELRTQLVYEGRALLLRTLDRPDLLKTKLFALCDRGTDWLDCVALAPTAGELEEARPWLSEQDAHPGWPGHVLAMLAELRRRLGNGV